LRHRICVSGPAGPRIDSMFRRFPRAAVLLAATLAFAAPTLPGKIDVPADARAVLDKLYSGDPDAAVEAAQHIEHDQPEHPLGYVLEVEALWWKIWCTSTEFRYGMTYARHRGKLPGDQHYLDLVEKAGALAQAQIARRDTPEMEFYAGTADALAARFYGLRGETRNAARAGVRGREHLLHAITLDPELADADLGLGLYNYYVDTLSAAARILRFFMGIPGGTKQEGIHQLEFAIAQGQLTFTEARFYLAISLHNYDQKYERALELSGPLVEQYPSNPLFRLIRGDLFAKLGRKEQAVESYRAAAALPVRDPECRAHIQELVRASLAAVGANPSPPVP
jgi:tetratricopeptide (TPR) repeat protein